jgi:glutathione S-transferase
MYTLYYSPGACSMAIHVVLNELGQKVALEKVDLRAPRSPEFLKLNPRGQVPVLVEDGQALLEGAAIITYLCDKHGGLLPKSGFERAKALQWLMFANSTLHTAYSKAMWVGRTQAPDEASKNAFMETALNQVQDLWDLVEKNLETNGGPYLAGKTLTAGDILITVIANWSFLPRTFTFGPKTKALLKDVSARPAYQAALKAENVEYKAAA